MKFKRSHALTLSRCSQNSSLLCIITRCWKWADLPSSLMGAWKNRACVCNRGPPNNGEILANFWSFFKAEVAFSLRKTIENLQLREVISRLYRRNFGFLLRYRVDLHEISRFSKEKLKNSQRKRKKNWVENRDFWVVFLKKNNVKLRSIRSPLYEQLVQKLKYPRKQLGELYKMVPFAGRESEIRS